MLSKCEEKGKPHPGCPGHELSSVSENSAHTQHASRERTLQQITCILCSFIFQIWRTASLIVIEKRLNEKYFSPKVCNLVYYRGNTKANIDFHSRS